MLGGRDGCQTELQEVFRLYPKGASKVLYISNSGQRCESEERGVWHIGQLPCECAAHLGKDRVGQCVSFRQRWQMIGTNCARKEIEESSKSTMNL